MMSNSLDRLQYSDVKDSGLDLDTFAAALDRCTHDGTTESDPTAIAFAYYYQHVRRVFQLVRFALTVDYEARECRGINEHVQKLGWKVMDLSREMRRNTVGKYLNNQTKGPDIDEPAKLDSPPLTGSGATKPLPVYLIPTGPKPQLSDLDEFMIKQAKDAIELYQAQILNTIQQGWFGRADADFVAGKFQEIAIQEARICTILELRGGRAHQYRAPLIKLDSK